MCGEGIGMGSQIYFENIWGYGPSTGIIIRLGLFNRSPIVSVISKEGVSICILLEIFSSLNYCFIILWFVLDSLTHLCVIQNYTLSLRHVDQFSFVMAFLNWLCNKIIVNITGCNRCWFFFLLKIHICSIRVIKKCCFVEVLL